MTIVVTIIYDPIKLYTVVSGSTTTISMVPNRKTELRVKSRYSSLSNSSSLFFFNHEVILLFVNSYITCVLFAVFVVFYAELS